MKVNKAAARWQLFLGSLGILVTTLACVAIGVGTDPTANTPNPGEVTLQLGDGIVEVLDENGDRAPVAGDSSFDLTAGLESIDPWKVAGLPIETNESTEIETGLQLGELVRVRGFILGDGTWLANSIERAEEQVDPIIVLIGKVDSTGPWVVNGIQLNVTEDTEIQGGITPGMFVRVEILLLPDGTWEVLRIVPLGELEEGAGCATVVATVLVVEGNEIQLSGWPIIVLGEDVKIENQTGAEGTLSPDQAVLLVVCPAGEGQIMIVQIIILNNADDQDSADGGEKVLVCHKPDKKGGHTISISSSAVPAHLAHGDTLGRCP